MSKQTWLLMVKVVQQESRPRPQRKTQRPLPVRCVREDHYALLLAAGY